MARKKSTTLTEVELRLMQVLWRKGPATVGEVAEALKPGAAYTTVLTMLRILERKGYLRHEKAGRAFVYEPVVAQSEASRHAVNHLVSRFFNDSPELLVLNLLESERINDQELKRLRQLIKNSK